jgi:hypothetical protein
MNMIRLVTPDKYDGCQYEADEIVTSLKRLATKAYLLQLAFDERNDAGVITYCAEIEKVAHQAREMSAHLKSVFERLNGR